mgnify:CR=1 FL=1
MKETMSAPRQRRFLALAAAAAACIVGLALWYAVPPAPAQEMQVVDGEDLPHFEAVLLDPVLHLFDVSAAIAQLRRMAE